MISPPHKKMGMCSKLLFRSAAGTVFRRGGNAFRPLIMTYCKFLLFKLVQASIDATQTQNALQHSTLATDVLTWRMPEEIKSKGGTEIDVGDQVVTPIRGGKHEFEVEKIITDEDEACAEGAKGAFKPPVVVGIDQNDNKVSHKPGTVTNLSKE